MSILKVILLFFFFSSRRRHTRWNCDWSSDVCSSDLGNDGLRVPAARLGPWALATDTARYYLVLVVGAVMVWAAGNLARTRTGRALLALRESEVAAQASGIHVEIGRASCRERV